MKEILETARKQLRIVKSLNRSGPTDSSPLWRGIHDELHDLMMNEDYDAREIIGRVTKLGHFTFPRSADDPKTERIVRRYLNWLRYRETPISEYPPEVCESHLTDKGSLISLEGRLVSTMLLLHLCIWRRVRDCAGPTGRILEIGGGYGGLARIAKLMKPDCVYYIVDLPESLFFSYIFLKENFPKSNILYVCKESDVREIRKNKLDFVFVPNVFLHLLEGLDVDLVINTISFGEMTQNAVDSFMSFIQDCVSAKYFYSINRFGQRPGGDLPGQAPRWAGDDAADTCVKLDASWNLRYWSAWGEDGFSQFEQAAAPYLEILVERTADRKRSIKANRRRAAGLYQSATIQEKGGNLWHRYMWDAIRIYPSRTCLEEYCDFFRANRFPELKYYESLLDAAGADFDQSDFDSAQFTVEASDDAVPVSDEDAAPATLRYRIQSLRDDVAEILEKSRVLQDSHDRFQDGFERTLRQHDELRDQRDDLLAELDRAMHLRTKLEEKLERQGHQNEELKGQLNHAQRKSKELETGFEQTVNQHDDLKARRDDMQKSLAHAHRQIAESAAQRETVLSELNGVRDLHEELKGRLDDAHRQIQALREELEKKERQRP